MLNSEVRNEKNASPKTNQENNKRNYPFTGTVVKCSLLRVRENPSADAPVVTEIPAGTIVNVAEIGSVDFCAVCLESGITGYCMREFIKFAIPDEKQ